MKLNFDFEKHEPPGLSEKQLQATLEKRRELRGMLLLLTASNLIFISLGLLAFALAPYSMLLSFICLAVLGILLSSYGVLAVLFSKKLSEKFRKSSGVHFALRS